jgi:hypothetical protein
MLLILAITLSPGGNGSNNSLNGLGFLQIIWVLEHHPDLFEILEPVSVPTDYNLRSTWMVKVRLLDALSNEDN